MKLINCLRAKHHNHKSFQNGKKERRNDAKRRGGGAWDRREWVKVDMNRGGLEGKNGNLMFKLEH